MSCNRRPAISRFAPYGSRALLNHPLLRVMNACSAACSAMPPPLRRTSFPRLSGCPCPHDEGREHSQMRQKPVVDIGRKAQRLSKIDEQNRACMWRADRAPFTQSKIELLAHITMDMKERVTRLGRSIGLTPAVQFLRWILFVIGLVRCASAHNRIPPDTATKYQPGRLHRSSHNSPTGRWRRGPAGAIVSLHDGLIHETSRHPVRALVCRPFDGRRSGRCCRRKGAVVALQCAWSGSAIPAQQASGGGLGLRCLLVRMRLLLCLGIG